jgi:hypothetical protein
VVADFEIGDQSFEIVGVAPRDFTGTENGTVTDVFLPLSMNRSATQERINWHRIFLMLKPGIKQATALDGELLLDACWGGILVLAGTYEHNCCEEIYGYTGTGRDPTALDHCVRSIRHRKSMAASEQAPGARRY